MADLALYADGRADHDPLAGEANFDATVAAIREGKVVTVVPTPGNFWRLGRVARFALSLRGRGADLPDFRPQDHLRLGAAFAAHADGLRERLRESGVHLGEPAPALRTLIEKYDAAVDTKTKSNMLRLLGTLTDGCFIGPHTFHLDVSNRCNTNCVFCGLHSPLLIEPKKPIRGRRFTEGWATRQVDMEIFERLVEDLAAIGTREDILFSGEGEPLTHPHIRDMIRLVRGKNLALTVFTNGIALDEPTIDLLVEVDLDILYWSLSAPTAASFARQQPARRETDFAPMVARFKSLVEKKRRRHNKPYIILAHVINRLNAAECEQVMDLAVETGVDAVRYQIMHQCGAGMGDLLITKAQFPVIDRQIAAARRAAKTHGIDIVANIDFQIKQVAENFNLAQDVPPDLWSRDLYNRTGCLAGWFFGRSFTDGRLSFCCHDKIVGSLYRGRFRDIWFSERYRKLRQAAKAFSWEVNPELVDESCGGPLLGPDCEQCGNYEFINQALADLDRLGLRDLLRRDVPQWP